MNFAFISNRLQSLRWRSRSRNHKQWLGRRGERTAARHLRRHRYRILVRNYRCPAGEIDLICTDGDTIVFVEVKTRCAGDFALNPQEVFHKAQWQRIEKAARYFLRERSAQDRPCRFDLVMVTWPRRGAPRIDHYDDAFPARR